MIWRCLLCVCAATILCNNTLLFDTRSCCHHPLQQLVAVWIAGTLHFISMHRRYSRQCYSFILWSSCRLALLESLRHLALIKRVPLHAQLHVAPSSASLLCWAVALNFFYTVACTHLHCACARSFLLLCHCALINSSRPPGFLIISLQPTGLFI